MVADSEGSSLKPMLGFVLFCFSVFLFFLNLAMVGKKGHNAIRRLALGVLCVGAVMEALSTHRHYTHCGLDPR